MPNLVFPWKRWRMTSTAHWVGGAQFGVSVEAVDDDVELIIFAEGNLNVVVVLGAAIEKGH